MSKMLPRIALLSMIALPVLAQTPPPLLPSIVSPSGQSVMGVVSYCWNGTTIAVCLSSSGSGGGPVTPAGTSSTTAAAVQGVTGGVPVTVTQPATGTTSDTAYTGTGMATVIAALKGIYANITMLTSTVATAALQPALNGDGGSLAHVTNFPANQPVTVTGDATAATDTLRVPVSNPDILPFSGSASSASVIVSIDTTGYSSIVAQITANASSNTVTFETSNDNATWLPTYGTTPSAALSAPVSGVASIPLVIFPVTGRYFRARISTYVGGSTTLVGYARSNVVPQLDPQTAVRTVTGTVAIAAGGNLIGTVAAVPPAVGINTSLLAKVLSAATTNATLLKSAAAALNGYSLTNSGAGWAYLHIYNLTTAPTVGTSVPTFTIGIPPGGSVSLAPDTGIFTLNFGFAYSITGGASDTDATAVAVNQVAGFFIYR